jgi:hydroxypyruvate reductase
MEPAGMSLAPRYADRLDHLAALLGAALEAADPGAIVRRSLRLDGQGLRLRGTRILLPHGARLFLVAFGKAASAMASAAVEILGERLTSGIVTVLAPAAPGFPPNIQVIRAAHPLPDEGSLRAGRAMLDLAGQARRGDIVLALVSGGGSAMAEALRPGVGLEDLRRLTAQLLLAGAPVHAINAVRAGLSDFKGGGLARAASPARVVGLLLSDVVGDDPASIASGPTVVSPRTALPARRTLERLGLWQVVPESIGAALTRPMPPAAVHPPPVNLIIARNADLLAAAAGEARRLGFQSHVLTGRLQGEASTVGARLGRRLRQLAPPACLLAGGETTVTLRRGGRGGRNQELALAAARSLDGADRSLLASFASDGVDGPTEAAGACVDGGTIERGRALGLEARQALEAHDTYPFLNSIGALLLTGPTGTNLNDLVIGLRYGA